MAVLISNISIDMGDINFYRALQYSVSYGFTDGINLKFGDRAYSDSFQLSYRWGSDRTYALLGDALTSTGSSLTGGNLSALFEIAGSGLYGELSWALVDIQLDARLTFAAFQSPTTSDDFALLRNALNGDDVFFGSRNNDKFFGYSGNDSFLPGSGNDIVYGGLGYDQVGYEVYRAAASVKWNADRSVSVSGQAVIGVDILHEIERIDFADGSLLFDVGSAKASSAYRLYGGAFDRTPDEAGFRFWTQTLDEGSTLHNVATSFIVSKEFVGRYGSSLSNAAFVDALYLNVLNRPGEPGGVAYWNGVLNKKLTDRADVLVSFTQLPEFVGISAANITNGYWVV